MPLQSWTKIKQICETVNKWWTYRVDQIILPSGKIGEYHYVHTNGSSLVVPITDSKRILMVRQYRYLAGMESIEFPCGSVKEGLDYENTAQLELAEEAGVSAGELILVGQFNPYNGVTDEICKVYLARNLKEVSVPHDDTEEFERIQLSFQDIDSKIQSSEIWDGMSIAAWLIVKGYLF